MVDRWVLLILLVSFGMAGGDAAPAAPAAPQMQAQTQPPAQPQDQPVRPPTSDPGDPFGQEVILVPDGEEHFTVTLPVVMSPQFFGWLFGLDGGLVLTGPRQAVEAYRQKLSAAAAELST